MKMVTGVEPTEDKVIAYKNSLKLVDHLIGKNKYLTGNELTIADLSLLSITSIASDRFDLTDYPNFKRWVVSIKADLPYYQAINHFEPEEMADFMVKIKEQFKKRTQNK